MKTLLAIFAATLLSGCSTIQNWSEQEKQTAWIVVSVLATGAIVANSHDGDTVIINNNCHANPHKRCD